MISEHRLIGYNTSDFNDPTRYNSRIAEANAAQQQNTRDAALNSVTRDYYGNNVPEKVLPSNMGAVVNNWEPTKIGTSGNYQVSTPTQGDPNLLREAQTVYGAQPGQQTVYQNPNNGTIGQAVNIPDGQIALNAFNRLNDSGMSYTDSANRLNDPSYKQGIQQASNTGLQDAINSIPRMITVQAGTDKNGNAIFKQIEDPNYAKNVANTRLSFSQNDANALTKHDQATKAVAASAASQNASKDSAKPGQATATPSPDEARVNAMIASLPPEYAFLGDAYRAQVAAEGEQKAAAQANYTDANASANASHDGYAKIIDQMASDQKTLYEDSKEFIATAQENRQKAIAEQQALTKEMLAAQEQSQNREMRRNLDKQLNSLVTAQALGGGFGSSNWNAEVSQAAYDGEQAILDMHKEFGFKKVDADIQFTEQMNSVYEFYGQKKLDAMKDYRSTLDQIAQYRFSNEDTTTQRKDKARADYRTTLAGIAKDHAAELKDLTKTVVGIIHDGKEQEAKQRMWEYEQSWDQKKFFTQQATQREEFQIRRAEIASNNAIANGYKDQARFDQTREKISDNVRQDPVITDYQKVKSSYGTLTQAYEEGQRTGNKIAADQALITMFNKMMDPSSVVRPSEYATTAENAPVFNKIIGNFQAYVTGGAKLTDADRQAIKRMADQFIGKYNERFEDVSQRYLLQMQSYNRTAPDGYQLSPDMFGLPVTTTTQQRGVLEQFEEPGLFPSNPFKPQASASGLLDTLAQAHQEHEGYGTKGAKTITAQNNPGALRWNPAQKAFGGEPGDNGFTKFPDYESGLAALKSDLRAKLTGKSSHIDYSNNPTLLSYIKVYAPTTDGNNPTGYAKSVVNTLRKAGYDVNLNTPLSDLASLIG